MLPHKRHEGLVVREMDAEILVYDRSAARAVCLNETSAFIWSQCDGSTSADELIDRFEGRFGFRVEPGMIDTALADLGRANLLLAGSEHRSVRSSRRALLAGLAGFPAALLPTVTLLSAPTAAQAAASCRAAGKACTANAQCCSKLCTKVKGSLVCQ